MNDEKGFYHCFSTGEHGNIFDFLMKTRSLRFGEAVKVLASETKKCSLGGGTILQNNDASGGITCSDYSTAVTGDTAGTTIVTLVQTTNVGKVFTDKNPHTPSATTTADDGTTTTSANYAVGSTGVG